MEFVAAVDRVEGGIAVLVPAADASGPADAAGRAVQAGQEARLLWPLTLLPPGAAEGLYYRIRVDPDPEASAAGRRRVGNLLDALRGRDRVRPGGATGRTSSRAALALDFPG